MFGKAMQTGQKKQSQWTVFTICRQFKKKIYVEPSFVQITYETYQRLPDEREAKNVVVGHDSRNRPLHFNEIC